MIHTFIGGLGHFLIILAFVAALVATYAYFKSVRREETIRQDWLKFGRGAFYIHGAAVLGIVVSLFFIINSDKVYKIRLGSLLKVFCEKYEYDSFTEVGLYKGEKIIEEISKDVKIIEADENTLEKMVESWSIERFS